MKCAKDALDQDIEFEKKHEKFRVEEVIIFMSIGQSYHLCWPEEYDLK